MKRGKSKSTEPAVPMAAKVPEPKWVGGDDKNVDNFLYPSMPGSFAPARIRKYPIEKLRDRYLQVFSASMGNHSLSLYYCCWTQEQFDSALDKRFEERLIQARGVLADRATLIMHKGMGLVAGEGPQLPPTVTAAMAKVVESMTNPDGTRGLQKKAYKLTVNGLQRPAPTGSRGPGRPRGSGAQQAAGETGAA